MTHHAIIVENMRFFSEIWFELILKILKIDYLNLSIRFVQNLKKN